MINYKIGIAGYGVVGGALGQVFPNAYVYDKYKNIGDLIGLNECDIIFICTPTSTNREFDLSYIKDVLNNLNGEKIVVIKSTILPGVTDFFQESYPQHLFLFNPEFLSENTASEDTLNPDKQIIGYTTDSAHIAENILKILPDSPCNMVIPAMDAEISKYFINCFYSVKVSFANQMYDVCDKLDINYDNVKNIACNDRMISPSHLDIFHKGYRGFSGKCLPKDIQTMVNFVKETLSNCDVSVLESAIKYNNKL